MTSSKQEEKIEYELKKLVDLFLKTNASDIELSEITGISSSTVQRRLTDKNRFIKYYPKGEELYLKILAIRKNNRENGKEKGAQNSKLNSFSNNKKVSSKLRLNIFCKNKEEEIDLLFKIAIKYRLHKDSICDLFPYKEEDINEFSNNYSHKEALDYLFNYDKTNQDVAKMDVIEYYRKLINTKKSYELNNLIASLSQIDTKNFKEVLNYQVKYALNNSEILYRFNINRDEYNKEIYEILESDPILKNEYINLALFISRKGKGR